MVRPMLYGQPHVPGAYTVLWDGLDRYGDPLPPAHYEWRLLETPGFSRRFLVNVGIQTPWTTMDVWPGNHYGANVLGYKGGNLYVGAVSTEGPPSLISITLDGSKKNWDSTGTSGQSDPIPGGLSHIAVLTQPTGMKMTRPRDGYVYTINDMGDLAWLLIGTVVRPYACTRGSWAWVTVPNHRRGSCASTDLLHAGDTAATHSPMGMCGATFSGKNCLIVSYLNYNEVHVIPLLTALRGDTGGPPNSIQLLDLAARKIISVPSPGQICFDTGSGLAYAISGTNVISIDPVSGSTATLALGLNAPSKIAYSGSAGNASVNDLLVVVNNGNCVQRWSVSEFYPKVAALVTTYGNPNGRTYGAFNPLDFGDIQDIVADGAGGYVTVEDSPRRVAHFKYAVPHPPLSPPPTVSPLLNQWIGGFQWGQLACIDPADTTITYMPIDPQHIGKGKIDYTTHSWTLTDLYPLVDHMSWYVGKNSVRDILPGGYYEVRHVSGQTFLLSRGGGAGCHGVTLLRVDDVKHQIVPVSHIGGLHPTIDAQLHPAWWLHALRANLGITATPRQSGLAKYFSFSFSDTNQNGVIDIPEIAISSVGNHYVGSAASAVAANWDVLTFWQSPKSGPPFAKIANEGTPTIPVWTWDHAKLVALNIPAREQAVIGMPTSIAYDASGAVYGIARTGQGGNDVPPLNWPNNASSVSRFLKWDAQGNELFSVGTHGSSKFPTIPGVFADVRNILANVKDCMVVLDACAPATVWTQDGLYAGSFLDNVNIPPNKPGWQSLAYYPKQFDDNQWGQVIETTTGDVLWGQMRDNSTAVYRITGWNQWERQHGELVLKEEVPAARRKGTGLTGEYFASPDLTGQPVFTKRDPVLWFGPMRGDHRQVEARLSWFNQRDPRLMSQEAPISVRWKGSVEAPLSEPFTFRIYLYGKENSGARVRLWIANKLTIDSWKYITLERFKTSWGFTRELVSAPIALQVGVRVPIRIEYASPRIAEAHLHLYWSSPSFDLRHVPRAYLYTDEAAIENL
jgi:hypothetical protein